mgnify:CR=1 FL=1
MKSFFKNLLASILGCFIALGTVFLLSFIILAVLCSPETYTLKDKTVLNLKLEGVLSDRIETANPLSELFGMDDDTAIGLDDILSSIDKVGLTSISKGCLPVNCK